MDEDVLVRAWIAVRLQINPENLASKTRRMDGKERVYNHHLRGEIKIDCDRIVSEGRPRFILPGTGLESKRYLAFVRGYTGGERNGFFYFPGTQKAFNEGVEARSREDWKETRFDESEMNVVHHI